MLLFSTGLAVAATLTTARGYGRLALALAAHGRGHGTRRAPRRPSRSWASLPPERANIGSAVNDTTRELGGALGVAIVGSIMSSLVRDAARRRARRGVPAPVAAAARESLGAARPAQHRRRRPRPRSLRPRDVARVGSRRARGRARRRSSPGGTCRLAPALRSTARPVQTEIRRLRTRHPAAELLARVGEPTWQAAGNPHARTSIGSQRDRSNCSATARMCASTSREQLAYAGREPRPRRG